SLIVAHCSMPLKKRGKEPYLCQKKMSRLCGGLNQKNLCTNAVLEHQDKPREFLEAIKSMLKPSGYIAGSVPNRDSWELKTLARKITHTDFPPHHFLWFSKESLDELYRRMGFSDILIKASSPNISNIVSLLQAWLTGSAINKRLRKAITTHEHAGVGTSIYRNLPLWRKIVFKGLKGIRFLAFLPFALYVKIRSNGGQYLYFQGREKGS
ncbi:MAG: methyltransferase domain-containing protein, partial [Aquificaceae bacterium]